MAQKGGGYTSIARMLSDEGIYLHKAKLKGREKDDAGFVRDLPEIEKYQQPAWWKTDMLPEPLRHDTGHYGSHSFLTHEFISALTQGRRPTVDIYEALAYTVPGIIAHESALRGGEPMTVPQFERPQA